MIETDISIDAGTRPSLRGIETQPDYYLTCSNYSNEAKKGTGLLIMAGVACMGVVMAIDTSRNLIERIRTIRASLR